MKNLRMGKKLLVTFGIVIVLMLVIVGTAITGFYNTMHNFNTFYERAFQSATQSIEMQMAIQSAAKNFGYAIMESSASKKQEYINSAQEQIHSLDANLTFLKEHFDGDQTLISSLETTMKNSAELRDSVFQMAMNNENARATVTFFNKLNPFFLEAQNYLQQINDQAEANAHNYYTESSSQSILATLLLVATALVIIAMTIILAVYLGHGITRPLAEIELAADQLVTGNLDVTVTHESQDELGKLAQSMRILTSTFRGIIKDMEQGLDLLSQGDFSATSQAAELYVGEFEHLASAMYAIIDRLSIALTKINLSSDQVSGSAERVANDAQALSQGATEQASAVQQLAATVNQISQQVNDTASNAAQARTQADDSGEQVTACNQQMHDMIAAMGDITNTSHEIGKIIKTIEDIAFQTNILALNAAVEAARAGAAGKGFAVVADEVRNLASKSAEASKNTATLIESAIQAVEKGTQIAHDTAQSLFSVVEGTQTVRSTVDKIADAASQQANAISQVTQGIDQISAVIQKNSATAEQSAAASQELSGEAQTLKGLVAQFKVSDKAKLLIEQENQNYESNTVSLQALPEEKY